jgi:hypothetical protein
MNHHDRDILRAALVILDRERFAAARHSAEVGTLEARQESEDLFDACNAVRRLLGQVTEPRGVRPVDR